MMLRPLLQVALHPKIKEPSETLCWLCKRNTLFSFWKAERLSLHLNLICLITARVSLSTHLLCRYILKLSGAKVVVTEAFYWERLYSLERGLIMFSCDLIFFVETCLVWQFVFNTDWGYLVLLPVGMSPGGEADNRMNGMDWKGTDITLSHAAGMWWSCTVIMLLGSHSCIQQKKKKKDKYLNIYSNIDTFEWEVFDCSLCKLLKRLKMKVLTQTTF